MSKVSGRRPSAGVVIGILALVMAIAGTAIAGTSGQGKITKDKVKTIVGNLAPSLDVNSAKTAASATTAKTANSAKIATNVLSANVLANGTMLGSIPAGATSTRVSDGVYTVSFGRSIAGCTISASAANNQGPQLGFVGVGVQDANTLKVGTENSTTPANDMSFYVQAICPAG